MNLLLVLSSVCTAITIPNVSAIISLPGIFSKPGVPVVEGDCKNLELFNYVVKKPFVLGKSKPEFNWYGEKIIDCIIIQPEISDERCHIDIVKGGIGYNYLTLSLKNPPTFLAIVFSPCKYGLELLFSSSPSDVPPSTAVYGTTKAPTPTTDSSSSVDSGTFAI